MAGLDLMVVWSSLAMMMMDDGRSSAFCGVEQGKRKDHGSLEFARALDNDHPRLLVLFIGNK